MTIYERLGIRGVINGVGTVTRLGGSLLPPPVLEAMLEASRSYVSLPELQAACGRRIAELTHNEACYISSGAAAGLVLATAACITGNDPEKMALLPHPERVYGNEEKAPAAGRPHRTWSARPASRRRWSGPRQVGVAPPLRLVRPSGQPRRLLRLR